MDVFPGTLAIEMGVWFEIVLLVNVGRYRLRVGCRENFTRVSRTKFVARMYFDGTRMRESRNTLDTSNQVINRVDVGGLAPPLSGEIFWLLLYFGYTPPFSLIPKMIQKVQRDKRNAYVVLPKGGEWSRAKFIMMTRMAILAQSIPRALRVTSVRQYKVAGAFRNRRWLQQPLGEHECNHRDHEQVAGETQRSRNLGSCASVGSWLQRLTQKSRPALLPAVGALHVAIKEEGERHAELLRQSITFAEYIRVREWARKYDRIQDHVHCELYLDVSGVLGMRSSGVLSLRWEETECVKNSSVTRYRKPNTGLTFSGYKDSTGTTSPHCLRHARAVQRIFADVPTASIRAVEGKKREIDIKYITLRRKVGQPSDAVPEQHNNRTSDSYNAYWSMLLTDEAYGHPVFTTALAYMYIGAKRRHIERGNMANKLATNDLEQALQEQGNDFLLRLPPHVDAVRGVIDADG
eukprot:gene1032-250_t